MLKKVLLPTKISELTNFSINKIHLKIFGQPIGTKTQKFINNLGLMSLGTIGGIVFIFITNIFAGRLLGPTEYGKYALIISLGQIFIIPMTFGINTASVKYISSSKNKLKKKLFAQNTIFLSILFTFLTSIICLIFNSQFSNFLKINNQIFIFILIYSVILSFKYISEALIKGFHQFKLLSSLEFINSFIICLSFFVFIFLTKNRSFQNFIIPTIIGLSIYTLVFINRNYRQLKLPKINLKNIKIILNYGKYATLGSLFGITLNNLDKFVLNKYMSFSDIGIYSIYLSSSTFAGNYILQIFIQIFFPTISSIKEKTKIISKIFKLMTISFFPIIIANICSTSVILFLMGDKYEKNLIYILLFSLLGTLVVFSGILWWLIASFGIKGIRFTSLIGIFLGLLNIIIMILLTQTLGLLGTVYSLIITNIFIIIVAILKIKFYKDED